MEADEAGFKILSKGKAVKKILAELEYLIDSRTQKAAIKALLFLPWKKPVRSEEVKEKFPIVRDVMVREKIQTLLPRLDHITIINRSEEGGTGIYFIYCEFLDELPAHEQGQVIVKFLKSEQEAKAVIQADRFIRTMGFVTPHAKFISKETELGQRIASEIRVRHKDMGKNNELQILKQTESMNIILVMNELEAISLKLMPVKELVDLLANDEFILQLGAMIVTDAFINNYDRLGRGNCNLGNIMVDERQRLNLVDQEFNLTPDSLQSVKESLIVLLRGDFTQDILTTLMGALMCREEKVRLDDSFIQDRQACIQEGMRRGAAHLCEVLSNRFTLQRLFHAPALSVEGEQTCQLIGELIELIHQSQ